MLESRVTGDCLARFGEDLANTVVSCAEPELETPCAVMRSLDQPASLEVSVHRLFWFVLGLYQSVSVPAIKNR